MERSLTFYRDFIGMKVALEVDFFDDRIGRIGTVEECGKLAAFLASEDSSFMTGSIVTIDGGVTLGY